MKVTKRKLMTTFLFIIASITTPFTSFASSEDANLEKTKSVLEKVIQKEIDRGLASASVAIVKDDRIVWTGAYGYANVGMKALATPETIYPTCSSLKPVTATAILQLVEQGKIKLDDPANNYLGEHAVADDPKNSATVRSLLDHTSGLSDEEGQVFISMWDRYRSKISTLEEVAVKMESEEPLGERWRYNNSAYALAGLIVEKVSGVDYETYIVENILKPVGATTPHPINPTPEMTEMMANPYATNPEGPSIPVNRHVDSIHPAGGAYMRAEDMARFLGAHLNGGRFNGHQILSSDLIDVSHTANTTNSEGYGLGWWMPDDGTGRNLIEHAGRAMGFTVSMMGDLDTGVGVYVMTNATDQVCNKIADAAMRLMAGEEYSLEDRVAVSVDPAKLKRLWGDYYQQKSEFRYRVTSDGERLLVQISYKSRPFGNPMVYLPASETKFFDSAYGVELEFQENEAGEINGFSMVQHNWYDYGIAERIEE